MEPKVLLKVRKADLDLVESVLTDAMDQYKQQMVTKEVVATINREAFLPVECCGGVELSGLNGRIKVLIWNLLYSLY